MRDDSAMWVDLKFKVEGALELRGYRSDNDVTVQLNYINDALVMGLGQGLFIPSCTIVVFQGRVCAISFKVGGQLYACGEGGAVLALGFPLCHFEIRLTGVLGRLPGRAWSSGSTLPRTGSTWPVRLWLMLRSHSACCKALPLWAPSLA